MGLPGWILKLISSYLSNRIMVVRYKGETSEEQQMPGGSPAGTVLGIITFLIQMDGIRAFPVISSPYNSLIPPGIKELNTTAKFVDDLTAAAVINLKEHLQVDNKLISPLVYHSRTGHSLPPENNPLASQIVNISEFAKNNLMKINSKKSSIMLFSRSKKYDFQPDLCIDDKLLDVVEETKLLGVMVSSNLKWKKHVSYLRQKSMSKLWTLRRIKEIGGSTKDLLDVYFLQIRSKCEMACPSWNGSLTVKDIEDLEKIQKTALKIILGQKYTSYKKVLASLKIPFLEQRRQQLSRRFALKIEKSEKFKIWLIPNRTTRASKKYYLPKARTAIYGKSPLMYMAKLLNQEGKH